MSETRECLKFRLEGSDEDIGLWGHEYIRHLAGEVAAEWNDKITENPEYDTSKLMKLVKQIVPYDMAHNSETDCTDLLMEIERLDLLIDSVDQKCYKKVCLYLKSCVPYDPDPENTILMKTALQIYRKFDKYCEAMVVALQLNDDMADGEELQEIMSNSHLNTNFLALARELDIMDAKTPEDIYKSHLEKSSHSVD